jgi:hypothetical protein
MKMNRLFPVPSGFLPHMVAARGNIQEEIFKEISVSLLSSAKEMMQWAAF